MTIAFITQYKYLSSWEANCQWKLEKPVSLYIQRVWAFEIMLLRLWHSFHRINSSHWWNSIKYTIFGYLWSLFEHPLSADLGSCYVSFILHQHNLMWQHFEPTGCWIINLARGTDKRQPIFGGIFSSKII